MVSVNLISEDSYELEKFLSSFYNSSFDINDNLNWEHKYSNPVELAEIIGAYVDNLDKFKSRILFIFDFYNFTHLHILFLLLFYHLLI